MAVREKWKNEEQPRLHPQSEPSSPIEGMFCRQTQNAFQDALQNPVILTKKCLWSSDLAENCLQYFAEQKEESLSTKTADFHTLACTQESVRSAIGKVYTVKISKSLCCAALLSGGLVGPRIRFTESSLGPQSLNFPFRSIYL